MVYRSSISYDGSDAVTLWLSGARSDAGQYIWGAAVLQRRRADLLAVLAELAKAALPPPPAELTEWPERRRRPPA